MPLPLASCADDSHGDGDGGDGSPDADSDGDADTDTDTDSDSDTDSDGGPDAGDDWCPVLPTSCTAPSALESCGDDSLAAPRLIAPLSGRYIRDRRPEIIWDGAPADAGVSLYRVEIARDRAFTDVVYRSADYEAYPGIDNRFHHIVSCDLDCGVHFFRVVSVTSAECEVGTPTYTWEISVGMAPFDLDRDGVPDIMCWHVEPAGGEFENDLIQGYAIFDLDERGGTTLTQDDLEKVVEFEVEHSENGYALSTGGQGDVNGDNKYDIGLDLYNKNDGITYIREYFVFTNIQQGKILNEEDAVFNIKSIQGNNNLFSAFPNAGGFFFYDINGDGFSDIILQMFSQAGFYVVYGTEDGFRGNLDVADVTYHITEGFTLAEGFADINGDGYSDLIGVADVSDDTGPYFWDSVFYRFGEENPASEYEALQNTPTVTEMDSGLVIDDWEIGPQMDFSYLNIVGDIDFDGKTEIALETPVYNLGFSDSMSFGGIVILQEYTEPSIVSYGTVYQSIIVGDFLDTASLDNIEILDSIEPSGDVNSDGIDDFCFSSFTNDDTDYLGSHFCFTGRQNWNSFYLSSAAESIVPTTDSNGILRKFLSDIDGDNIADIYNGNSIRLSSGEIITIPSSISYDYCQYGQGWLLPTSLM